MVKRLFLVFILLISLFLVSCTPAEKICDVDSDCVKAACCHADDVVNKANRPDCRGIVCTAECQPNTLDCGQGEIKCQKGKCVAVLNP